MQLRQARGADLSPCLQVAGLGCEDALTHLLNFVWPNIFETSPHVVQAVQGAIDGCRLALGPSVVLSYTLQGLFHPARKVCAPSLYKLCRQSVVPPPVQLICVRIRAVSLQLAMWACPRRQAIMSVKHCASALLLQVREVYWKIYNNLYIGSQDSLVAFYPRLEDEEKHSYYRQELDVFI